jgi:phenylacetate-CoA ligase
MLLTRLFWSAYLAYHLRDQARYPFKPLDVIKRDQARRVRAMVSYAYRYVLHYRETMDQLGLTPADFQGADDLSKLPLVERHQLVGHPERFVSTAQPLDRYLQLRSSGSSGLPSTIRHDARAVFQNAAHAERDRCMITPLLGRRVGYRETVIGVHHSATHAVQQFLQERGLFPRGVRIQRQYLSLLDPTGKNLGLINEFKPDIIHSYGSYLDILFPFLHATGATFHRPRVVTYSSDGLLPSVRHLIEKEFNIPVFSTYQATEAFKIAFECEHHQGMHLNIDLYPVRIVDEEGREVAEGESGEVVVSNLVNRGTVLFNFRLGDIAAILPDRCPCGRSLPLLSFLQGRKDDLIELPSGELIHPLSLKLIFLVNEPEIWEYQILQTTPRHLRVAIVAAETCDRPQMKQRIAAKMTRVLGSEVKVDISFVDSIDRTVGGKFRTVISNCISLQQPADNLTPGQR